MRTILALSSVKFLVSLASVWKRLDETDAAEGFLDQGVDIRTLDLKAASEFAKTLAVVDDGNGAERQQYKGDDGEFPVLIDDDAYQADDGDAFAYAHDDRRDALANAVDVSQHPGHEHAHLTFLEEAERQEDDAAEHLVAKAVENEQAGDVHEICLGEAENGFDHDDEEERQWNQEKGGGVLLYENIVHGGFDQIGRGRIGSGNDDGRQHADGDFFLVGNKIGKTTLEQMAITELLDVPKVILRQILSFS